jgi:hypothetical protein
LLVDDGLGYPDYVFLAFHLEYRSDTSRRDYKTMGTVRFSKVVEAAGKPTVHVLWIDPAKDATLRNAVKTCRVMTVHQQPATSNADYGSIGFEKNVSGQILIFPKSLKQFCDQRVVGVKYDLLEWPTVPKSRQAPKGLPSRRLVKANCRTLKHPLQLVTRPPPKRMRAHAW